MTKIICAVAVLIGIAVAGVAKAPRAQTSPVVESAPPVPVAYVAPSPSCNCPNCGCDKCECTGGTCRCPSCIAAVQDCGPNCRCSGPWLGNYAAAHAKATREKLPMLVVVSTTDCPPCRELERTLATVDLTGFVCVKIDAATRPDLLPAFGVTRFPSLVVSGPGPGLAWRSTTAGALDAGTIRGLLAPPLNSSFAAPLRFSPVSVVRSAGC